MCVSGNEVSWLRAVLLSSSTIFITKGQSLIRECDSADHGRDE